MRRNQKWSKKGCVDYISNLPDAIIGHILSSLPIETVVQTCLLSKRWEKLWTEVPIIDYFPDEKSTCYKNFVENVLCQNTVPCLLRFRCYFCGYDIGYNRTESCLRALSTRPISELDMTFNLATFYLPDWVFSRDCLVVLKLKGCEFKDSEVSISLPNLEVIHLVHILFPGDQFLKRLSSNCPVLREILIEECSGVNDTLYIESSSLKSLTIRDSKAPAHKISITAPSLRYVGLHDTTTVYDLGDLSLLTEANLDSLLFCSVDPPAKLDHTCELIRKISGVKTLRLGGYLSLSNLTSELPIFRNLTCLKLAFDRHICELLQHVPSLKFLIVEDVNLADASLLSNDVPQCLSVLERVELTLRKYGCNDLVAYILKAATALKEMSIKMRPVSIKHERAIYQSLLNLPKSSTVCQLKVIHLPR